MQNAIVFVSKVRTTRGKLFRSKESKESLNKLRPWKGGKLSTNELSSSRCLEDLVGPKQTRGAYSFKKKLTENASLAGASPAAPKANGK